MVFVNVFYGWTNVLGHAGEMRRLLDDLGMQIIEKCKADLRETTAAPARGRPSSALQSPPARTSIQTGPSAGTVRCSPKRHVAVSFHGAGGMKPRTQRYCVSCGKHTTYFCNACGVRVPVHPPRNRYGVVFDCLETHRKAPEDKVRAGVKRGLAGEVRD